MMMSKVRSCEMQDCYYNQSLMCHAQAINVGSEHPKCDTYQRESEHGGDANSLGQVGACKVDECTYNINLLCNAPEIVVAYHENHADCATYTPKLV